MRAIGYAAIVGVFATGCATGVILTDEGERVVHTTQADMPGGCTVLGDVPVGVAADASHASTEDELVILMRNKAGESGATHVIIDTQEQRNTAEGAEPSWVGRGRAYNCPREVARAPAEPRIVEEEPTSGGESPEGTPAAEGAPAEGATEEAASPE